jgi:CRP/FNR family cyclic AMP-dependent transcriptional regulator
LTMSIQTFQPGELILAEGTYGKQTFLIQSGEVMICKEVPGHPRVTLATLGEGEMFGEMCLFEESGTRTASVVARTAVQLELIPRERIEAAMAETPALIQALLKSLSNRLAQTSQLNTQLQAQQPDE